jgi:hypothetical protein
MAGKAETLPVTATTGGAPRQVWAPPPRRCISWRWLPGVIELELPHPEPLSQRSCERIKTDCLWKSEAKRSELTNGNFRIFVDYHQSTHGSYARDGLPRTAPPLDTNVEPHIRIGGVEFGARNPPVKSSAEAVPNWASTVDCGSVGCVAKLTIVLEIGLARSSPKAQLGIDKYASTNLFRQRPTYATGSRTSGATRA